MKKTQLAALIGAGMAAAVSGSAIAQSSNPMQVDALQMGYNLAEASDASDQMQESMGGSQTDADGSSDASSDNDSSDSEADKSSGGKCGAGKCGS